jgi:hypothetical protein
MSLPPLLSERPRNVQVALIVIPSIVWGLITGWTLDVSEALYALANLIAIVGGVAGGFECKDAAAGAKRGVVGGLLFGVGILLADAAIVDHREATLPNPAILLVIVTAVGGALLGALGGALRARAMRRRGAVAG